MLSDAGSKYGVDDDEMSHYMGQSALGGAETGSNAGGYAQRGHTSAGGGDYPMTRSTTSLRQ